jgi:hypothetical protein
MLANVYTADAKAGKLETVRIEDLLRQIKEAGNIDLYNALRDDYRKFKRRTLKA